MSEDGTPSFEDALTRLSAVVETLEDGDLDLERSLAAFEEGVRLIRVCSGRLDAARLRVSELEEGRDGPIEKPSSLEEVE